MCSHYTLKGTSSESFLAPTPGWYSEEQFIMESGDATGMILISPLRRANENVTNRTEQNQIGQPHPKRWAPSGFCESPSNSSVHIKRTTSVILNAGSSTAGIIHCAIEALVPLVIKVN